MPEFRLVPGAPALKALANDYWETSSEKDKREEEEAFDAGRAIRDGDRSLETLKKIVHWKSPRVVHHLETNDPRKIETALEVAANHTDALKALKELQELKGVAIPVASAILTTIHPERYTIIDFRALEALGHFGHDEEFYIAYLKFCRELSLTADINEQLDLPGASKLRTLDRALWQWSASNTKGEKRSASLRAAGKQD
jgi:hypothetical protein